MCSQGQLEQVLNVSTMHTCWGKLIKCKVVLRKVQDFLNAHGHNITITFCFDT